MKDDDSKAAKCRMGAAQLQAQRIEKVKMVPFPCRMPAVPYNRPYPTACRKRENASFLQKSAEINRLENIKL